MPLCGNEGGVGGTASVAVAYTDDMGDYVAHVPRGWSGATVVSDVDAGGFTPVSRSYTNVLGDIGFQAYWWLPPQDLTVSGRIISRETGLPVAGATVGSADGYAAATDTNGQYAVAVPYLWSGKLVPAHPRGGIFLPGSLDVPEVHASVTGGDFLWTPPTPQISGRFVNVDTTNGVAGVVVTLSDGRYTATTSRSSPSPTTRRLMSSGISGRRSWSPCARS